MSAVNSLYNIINNENLLKANFKYCLIDNMKLPYKLNGSLARPNHVEDFIELTNIDVNIAAKYAGLGISIQASCISAVDVDRCFSKPFEIESVNQLGKEIINYFKEVAYVEFSFSGTGLRIFFRQKSIENYSNNYYIKNSRLGVEFYQPSNSARYVSITGKYIYNNDLSKEVDNKVVIDFLNKYMKRKVNVATTSKVVEDNLTIEQLMKKVKVLYYKNFEFQDLWFDTNHYKDINGNSLESDRDYHLLVMLYNNITKNRDSLKAIFEQSPYFKTKDEKHIKKWNYQNGRYFDYQYNYIRGQ